MEIVLRRVASMCEVSAPAVVFPESTAADIAKTM